MIFIKKNKFISVIVIFLSIILFFLLIDMTSISTKYVNKSNITFEVNNIRNPQLKKLARFLDNVYSKLYFFLSNEQKKNFSIDMKNYQELPDEIIVKAIQENLTPSNFSDENNFQNWHRSHGNHSSNRFSNLKDINLNNIDKLDLAWKYQFDEINGDIQSNPIYADNKIIMPSTGNSIVSLDPSNGKKIWEFTTDSKPARRGLIYVNNSEPLIFFCSMKSLYSLNASTGKPNLNFGNSGQVKIKKNCSITPVIIN